MIAPGKLRAYAAVVLFLTIVSATAQCVSPCAADYPESSGYVFDPGRSTATRTGGLAGIRKIYGIEGRFRLLVDGDAGTAAFDRVDAHVVDRDSVETGRSIDEYLNLSGLAGTIQPDGSILFVGNVHGGSDVSITLTCENDCVHLVGQTTPPPDSADFPIYHLDAVACRKYTGGAGEPNDPYQIATAADLIALGETPEDYDKHFILTADIDLDPNLPGRKVFDKAVIASGTFGYWAGGYGYSGVPFTGTLDGNGHIISHLTIHGEDNLGLFGQLGQDDQIQPRGVPTCAVTRLTLEGVSITGSGDDVGALAARIGWAVVSHSHSTGTISGNRTVGGLVGYNQHTVIHCRSTGTVIGSSGVGGLVGNNNGFVTYCCSTGTVNGSSDVGGLVGSHRGLMTESFSTGTVSGKDAIGGLIGRNGIVGRRPDPGRIYRSYSTASATGETYVGGLIGENIDGSVRQCYSTGTVKGTGQIGGLIGGGWSSDVTGSFWDIEASGTTVSSSGQGRTTAQMQTVTTFLDGGWDFAGETANGLHETWQMPEGGGYPVLAAFTGYTPPELHGQGTAQEPYLISDANELGAIIHYSTYAHYRLTASIDLSTMRWAREVIPHFAGTFDGNGHVISHLTMAGPDTLGLFRGLDTTAEVKNLGIVDATILGSDSVGVGALMGYNRGSVTCCYVTGTVSGMSAIGGLVGDNSGNLTCCYSTAAVSGIASVGGLVGYNSGTVTHCFSASTVFGDLHYSIGGMIGHNRSDIGTVLDCFWDVETSGQTTSIAGTAKTTVEMQTAETFLEAGWDFVGEAGNGTEDVWWIFDARDYPRLWWERVLDDDFEDGKAEPLWFVYEIDPDLVQIKEVNGRLETTASAEAQNVDAIYVANGWQLDVTKDFAIRVDFHFSKQDGHDGRVTLGVVPSLDPSARQWAELEAGRFDTGPFYLYEVRDGSWVQERVIERFYDDGTLYMSYNSEADELYFSQKGYGKANAWGTVPGLLKGRWKNEPVYIILGGGSEGMALTGEDAWLDNLVVNSGTLILSEPDDENEPDDDGPGFDAD